jgi:hypothetical protein
VYLYYSAKLQGIIDPEAAMAAGLRFPIYVGKCIYCGATEDLQDEHVIPYGLSGRWKLRKASCKEHHEITSAIEGRVQGWGFSNMRQRFGLRTRHKERRTGTLPVVYDLGGKRQTQDVPVAEHYGGFAVPVFTAPTYLAGGTPRDLPEVVEVRTYWHAPTLTRLLARLGTDTVNVPLVDPIDLARMLAKIAYAYAVACCDGDPDAFEEVYVRPTILDGPNAGHYVGCLSGPPVNTLATGHQISLIRTPRDVTAHIRLFAGWGLPEYTVVVGRMREVSTTTAA